MPKNENLLQPSYFAKFQCIGALCEDNCCSGMGVAIDKAAFQRYRNCEDPVLRPMMDLKVVVNEARTGDSNHAMITLTGATCPFLAEDRLCSIQKRLGEAALSRTCATYPRALSLVDGVYEQTLYMSCPEAARKALLNPRKMRFEELETPNVHYPEAPVLNTGDPRVRGKPDEHFWDIRSLVVSILQNRTYRVWERLIILGLFCDQLGKLNQNGQDHPISDEIGIAAETSSELDRSASDSIPDLIETYAHHVDDRFFTETLAGIAFSPTLQLDFVIQALEHRLLTDYASPRFVECYDQAMRGLGYDCDATIEDSAQHYMAAHDGPYRRFMEEREYILENYLVNYVFRNLFPLGPQSSLYLDRKSAYTEYALLVMHYVLIRGLLVGVAGHHRERFGEQHVVKTIQSFAKAIEHNPPFLKNLLRFLDDNGVNSLAFLAILVKDQASDPAASVSQLPLRFSHGDLGRVAKIFSAASLGRHSVDRDLIAV